MGLWLGSGTLPGKEGLVMIGPLEDLKHEHRLIERVLGALERATRALERGDEVSPETLAQALAFVRGFADGCHHAKEEQGLFPVLARKGPMLEAGPVKVLSADHEAGRKLMRDLEQAIEAMRQSRPEGRTEAHKAIALYTNMLRRHIAKEEEILFRLAETLISDDEAKVLEEHFEKVEQQTGAGAHERFEALVEELEAALGLPAPA